MASEYVRFSHSEKVYGERNLLQSQLDLLQSTKNLLAYKELRREENILKLSLKSKIKEAAITIRELEKTLPKIKALEAPLDSNEIEEATEEVQETSSLNEELEKIKRKLEHLQR